MSVADIAIQYMKTKKPARIESERMKERSKINLFSFYVKGVDKEMKISLELALHIHENMKT